MPTLTVKIAASGTTIDSNGSSLAGHMWLSIDSDGVVGSSAPVSLGFAPKDNQFGPLPLYEGAVHDNDDSNYRFTYYTGTVNISDTQYGQLLAFNTPEALEANGFSSFYTVGVNDCIAFVWKALQIIGINVGQTGDLLPADNADNIDQLLYSYLFGSTDGWQPDWSTQGNYNVTYGSANDDNLKAGTSDIATITDVIYGGAGNDTITGIIANEKLYGGADNDTLTGNGGNDYLEGGDGDDTYIYQAGDGFDTILDSDGTGKIEWDAQVIKGSTGLDPTKWKQPSDTAWRDETNHITYILKTQADGSDTLFIGKDGDTLQVKKWVEGNLGISLGAGSEAPPATRIYNGDQHPLGPAWYDWSKTSWAADGTLIGGVAEENFNDVIYGSGEADSINGLGGNDALDGRAGNDTLDGGIGDDLIADGAGSDIIYGGAGNDEILSATGLRVPPRNSPNDDWQVPYGKTLWIEGSTWGIAYDTNNHYTIYGGGSLTQDNAPDIIFAGDGDDHVTGGLGDDYIDGGLDNDKLWGHGGNDIIDGGDGNDFIKGDGNISPGLYQTVAGTNHGNDFLDGGEGADTVIGGGKNDVLFGGIGDDFLWGDDKTETDLASQYHGNDYLDGGDGDDKLFGGGGNDTLDGGLGFDSLDGGSGADTMSGGTDNDSYIVDNAGDLVFEAADEGYDSISSSVSLSLPDNVEIINMTGTSDIDVTGNAGDNYLYGNAGINQLVGLAGNDYLLGDAGDDIYIVNRGDGQDTIYNTDLLTATDTLRFGAGIADTDVLASQFGNSLLLKIKGSADQIYVSNYYDADWVNGSNIGDDKIDRVEFTNGVVWDQAALQVQVDRATYNHPPVVNAYLPTLQGSAGSFFSYTVPIDTIIDADVWDSISYSAELPDGSALPTWLGFDAASRTFSGTPGLSQVGSLTFILRGTDNYGYSSSETVTLNVAAPLTLTLNGGAGPDTLTGGFGNDTLNGLGGNDSLTGNAGNDVLNGGAGGDTLIGGMGDDTYIVDSANDVVTENLDEGFDDVQSSVTTILKNNIENLLLTGTKAINGTGNVLDNVLTGNSAINTLRSGDGDDWLDGKAGADKLVGGTGNDTLIGGTGDDIYIVDSSTDVITENLDEGVDSVQSSVSTILANNVENLLLTGTKAINGTGNALNNALAGNTAINSLTGAAGNDILDGRSGVDTLTGGAGNDTYLLGRSYGIDTVIENDSTVGNSDIAQFLTGVSANQIWFTHPTATNNLGINIIGTADSLVIKDWYLGTANHIELFKTVDDTKQLT